MLRATCNEYILKYYPPEPETPAFVRSQNCTHISLSLPRAFSIPTAADQWPLPLSTQLQGLAISAFSMRILLLVRTRAHVNTHTHTISEDLE